MHYHRLVSALVTRFQPSSIVWSCFVVTALAGAGWLWMAIIPTPFVMAEATPVSALQGPVIATMDSPVFAYQNVWQLSPLGADPSEPADPWHEPAGIVRFTYRGSELALHLAAGDYWGYLYITVDGQPANLLPAIPGNTNSQGQRSGYRTLYAPEQQSATGPTPQWVRVHRAEDATQSHAVMIELWRGWGQIPLRGVAIDGLPPTPFPRWPGVALLLLSGWALVAGIQSTGRLPHPRPPLVGGGIAMGSGNSLPYQGRSRVGLAGTRLVDHVHSGVLHLRPLLLPPLPTLVTQSLTGIALLCLGWGIAQRQSMVTVIGLLLLAWCSLQRPALWVGTLLIGLPFYYAYTLPLLPNRTFSLIDLGVFGGLGVLTGHWLLHVRRKGYTLSLENQTRGFTTDKTVQRLTLLLGGIVGWALLATVQADHGVLALHEWRTVFLTGGLFALLLVGTLRLSTQPLADQRLLVSGWIMGATLVALVGLWQYVSNEMLINAEGVQRVRAFYGSPNNLALYLERALAPLLAVALFAQRPYWRWLSTGLALVLGSALLLTFSKGALLLGVPALLVVLWVGGLVVLQQRGQSTRLLWVLAAIGGVGLLALTPFLATERFQRLFDFQTGTGFVRLQLWRSAWQMALDHPIFGVGPDNFLYLYRSFYILPAAWEEPNLNHPHNWPLDWWTRLGLPGLLLATGWFATMLVSHWRHLRANQQPVLNLGLLAAGVVALAHGLIDASYALPDLMIIWVLISYLPLGKRDKEIGGFRQAQSPNLSIS